MASKRKATTRASLGLGSNPKASAKSAAQAILPGKMPRGAKIRDTRADMPEPYTPPDEHNVSMRKIANGHIIRQHGYQDGKRFEHESFSPVKPSLQFEKVARAARLAGKRI